MWDPRAETYEVYLERWELEAEAHAGESNPFEPAEYRDGRPFDPKRRDLPRLDLLGEPNG